MTDSQAEAPTTESAPPSAELQPEQDLEEEQDQVPEPWHSEWFPDLAEPLEKQNLCTRVFCCPCHCGIALSQLCADVDCGGVMKAFCCCPCRTCCEWCPTSKEKGGSTDEPEEFPYEHAGEQGVEITYEQIFEMEQKRRQLLKATIN